MEKNIRYRFIFFSVLTLAIAIIITWRYFSLMVLQNTPISHADEAVVVERGPILDRNGRILAIQNQLDSVETWIPYIENFDETVELLSTTLNLDPETLMNDLTSRRGSMWIKRKITPTESAALNKLKSEGKLAGIYLRKEYGRNYPKQRLASHLLGYTGTDNIGLDGLEYTMNDILSPDPALSDQNELYGNQLFLTIDSNIEFFAEKFAAEALTEHKAESVMIVVMDAKNADLLACASVPDFDPNTFYNFSEEQRNNRAFAMAYEPGSVMKVFSIAAFIELGGIGVNSHFYAGGTYENEDIPETIGDLGIYGDLTPAGIIKYSSNVGAAYASETVSRDDFYQMLRALGFGSQTQMPVPGESSGLLRSPDEWSVRSKPTIAFGQEILVSAVQMATAATVFSNDGVLLRPHIIDRILSPDGQTIENVGREQVQRVFSPQTARAMLLMMETATEEGGTAHRMRTEGLRISAKTGTSQVIDPETGTYSTENFIASAMAIFPTDDPQLIIYVVIQNPKGDSYYGGRIASPIVKKLIDETVPYLGIRRSTDKVLEHSGKISVPKELNLTVGETLPDFTGMPKRRLLNLFNDDRLIINFSGDGWVVNQSPPPGTAVKDGLEIFIEFK
ncbi:MAG: penicillin-binding protein [Spirochaetales bacterium]|uniref:Penicillin-binding protein n=1 Tax=Candidatus Thalassospirochaeta sargassi TaxID=3119039 RepID=A0AAJ1IK57_9SPIO|nr:penicillin-binding protein [Spirochaetales bacterium]